MRFDRRGVAVLVLASAWPGTVAAEFSQTIAFSDVLVRARTSPQVALIARLELKRSKLKRDDVLCSAQVHDRTWVHLRGGHIGPYECFFGQRMLVLSGRTEYADAAGQKLRSADPALKEKAVRVTERQFRWRWKRAAGQSFK